jgi:Patatin-like phospholipase
MGSILTSLRLFVAICCGIMLAACAGPTVESLRDPVPEPLVTRSAVPGYARIRYWGDNGEGLSPTVVEEIVAQQRAAGYNPKNRSYLSVSGGGSNGAFGAGVLFGWTASGKRPEFTIVTGISTGSLIAPFAFLGPPYDEQLKAAYTEISGEDIYVRKGVFAILGSDSAADNSPLRQLVAKYVTDQMVTDIARENNRRASGGVGYWRNRHKWRSRPETPDPGNPRRLRFDSRRVSTRQHQGDGGWQDI